jgi:hypothetical protein
MSPRFRVLGGQAASGEQGPPRPPTIHADIRMKWFIRALRAEKRRRSRGLHRVSHSGRPGATLARREWPPPGAARPVRA